MISKLLFQALGRFSAGAAAVLEEELPGYREYKQRVKYRLLPYIW